MAGFATLKVGGLTEFQFAMQNLSNTCRQSMAITLNNCQRDVQNQATIKILRGFHTRVRAFDLPPTGTDIPQSWKATPDRLQATMALADENSPIGARQTQIFDKFGAAQMKVANDPRQPIAIPTTNLRQNVDDLIPPSMYPNKLIDMSTGNAATKFSFKKNGRNFDVTKRAAGSYFVMPNSQDKPSWGVWQRTGKGRDDIKMLWAFRSSVHIPHLLDFVADAEAVIAARFESNWDEAFARASGQSNAMSTA